MAAGLVWACGLFSPVRLSGELRVETAQLPLEAELKLPVLRYRPLPWPFAPGRVVWPAYEMMRLLCEAQGAVCGLVEERGATYFRVKVHQLRRRTFVLKIPETLPLLPARSPFVLVAGLSALPLSPGVRYAAWTRVGVNRFEAQHRVKAEGYVQTGSGTRIRVLWHVSKRFFLGSKEISYELMPEDGSPRQRGWIPLRFSAAQRLTAF